MILHTTSSKICVILLVGREEHIDFLRDLFNAVRGEPIKINRKEIMGRYIFFLGYLPNKDGVNQRLFC
jgi:hypothetical protein